MDRPEPALTPPPSSTSLSIPSSTPTTSSSPSASPSTSQSAGQREPDRRSTGEIRADVARERERMDLRLAELRGRLEPSAMAARARAAVTEKARRRGRAAVDAVRRRPVTASLVAGGALALVAALFRRR